MIKVDAHPDSGFARLKVVGKGRHGDFFKKGRQTWRTENRYVARPPCYSSVRIGHREFKRSLKANA